MKTIEVLRKLNAETKAEVYLVGGFVRDYLRNKQNADLDIVIRNLSLRNVKKFLGRHGHLKDVTLSKTNEALEVGILLFKAFDDVAEAQITLPRRGKKQIPDSHNTLRQDMRFRDFRINAMYLPINYSSKKDVIDLVGGKEDIASRTISSNGSAVERIKESPIRMLRAMSLAARTNYSISEDLIEAITANSALINKCSPETIQAELNEILLSKKPSKYLRLLRKTGLLFHIAPEIDNCVGVKQDTRYHKYDVFTHLIYTVDNCDYDLTIRLAGLLHDVGKPVVRKELAGKEKRVTFHKHEMVSVKLARDFMKRLRYDNDTTKDVLMLVKYHMYHFTREWTDSAIRKFIKKVELNEEFITEDRIGRFPLFRLRAAERLGNGLKGTAVTDRQKDFEKKIVDIYKESCGLEIKDLKVNGTKIMETFNLGPGVHIGDILKFLLDMVLEEPSLNDELTLLKLTTEYLHKNQDKAECDSCNAVERGH